MEWKFVKFHENWKKIMISFARTKLLCFFMDLGSILPIFSSGSSVAFANKSLDEQCALVAALNMARCFHIAFSS